MTSLLHVCVLLMYLKICLGEGVGFWGEAFLGFAFKVNEFVLFGLCEC